VKERFVKRMRLLLVDPRQRGSRNDGNAQVVELVPLG